MAPRHGRAVDDEVARRVVADRPGTGLGHEFGRDGVGAGRRDRSRGADVELPRRRGRVISVSVWFALSCGRTAADVRSPPVGHRNATRLRRMDRPRSLAGSLPRPREAGRGGMGYVYRPRDRNLGTDVVVKVPRRSMMDDPEFAGRFDREVRSLVALAHPHVVKVTDVGLHDGVPFAVMQYLSGGSLEDALGDPPAPAPLASLRDWLLPGGLGARLRPREGVRPPRREAGQHPLRRPRPRLPRRLRGGESRRLGRPRRPVGPDGRDRSGAGPRDPRNTWRPSW